MVSVRSPAWWPHVTTLTLVLFLVTPLFPAAESFSGEPVPDGFILVKAGSFAMGPAPGEKASYPHEYQSEVTLSRDYLMAKFELTVAEWNQVQAWAAEHGYTDLPLIVDSEDRLPAVMTWYQAVKWCNARSEMDGLTPVYRVNGAVYRTGDHAPEWDRMADGYRLPTEAEWEYATRAGTTTAFYTGDLVEDSLVQEPSPGTPVDPNLDRAGWHVINSGRMLHTPGLKEPNAWGFYDQHGNVEEWCWDRVAGYVVAPMIDPEGSYTNTSRRSRGGNFLSRARDCRSAAREIRTPNAALNTGLRLVRGVGYGVGVEEQQRIVVAPEVFAAIMEAELSGGTKGMEAWYPIQNAIFQDEQISESEMRFVEFLRLSKPEIAVYSSDGNSLIFHNNWEGSGGMGWVIATPTAEMQRIWAADIPLIRVTEALYATLMGLNPSSFGSRDFHQAGWLLSSVQRDGTVDDGEFRVLEMVVEAKGDFYFATEDKAAVRFRNAWRPDARRGLAPVFAVAQVARADFRDLWEGGEDGFAEMVRVFMSEDGAGPWRGKLVDFVARRVDELWAESTVQNGYGPLRSMIATRFSMIGKLDEELKIPARQLLYDGIKNADTLEDGTDGPIPSFLYNWIRPIH